MPFISKRRAVQLERYAIGGDAVVEMFCGLLSARGALMGNREDRVVFEDWEDRIIAIMRDMKPEVYRRLDKLDALPRSGRLPGETWDAYLEAVDTGERGA